jgi:hypothetical protein
MLVAAVGDDVRLEHAAKLGLQPSSNRRDVARDR